MIFVVFICLSWQVIVEQCSIDDVGLVLTDYYQKWCPACQKLDPVLQEIDNTLERHNLDIKIQKIDCKDCKCDDNDIQSYPTVVLRKDGKEISRFSGYKSYKDLGDFLVEHSNVDKEIFEGHIESTKNELLELTDSDMYQGLDGPWLVYFYYKDPSKFESTLVELEKIYDTKINFGKISYEQSKNFINQYNIKSYPAIYGVYNGLFVPFMDFVNLNDLSKFCDKLVEPSFKNIKVEDFKKEVQLLDHGEPLYIVFHTDTNKANQYFAEYAHRYKFKTRIFKTQDKSLFSMASIFPVSSIDKKNAEDSDIVKFGVYKNGRFYEYKGDISNEDDVAAWLFHTHFSYVTEIKTATFSSIFNGYKPAMILLTQGEQFMTEFNEFSADRHLGTPYINVLFAALDTNNYGNFVPTLLPNLTTPTLVIYDPIHKQFRHKEVELNKETFKETAMKVLKLYEQNSLELYPRVKTYKRYYLLGIGLLITAILVATGRSKDKKQV
ncbi:hypothetical protein P3W45_001252 [Vairimorpha bombi]|jgi:thioredoxin domain-containing protein 5